MTFQSFCFLKETRAGQLLLLFLWWISHARQSAWRRCLQQCCHCWLASGGQQHHKATNIPSFLAYPLFTKRVQAELERQTPPSRAEELEKESITSSQGNTQRTQKWGREESFLLLLLEKATESGAGCSPPSSVLLQHQLPPWPVLSEESEGFASLAQHCGQLFLEGSSESFLRREET